MKELLKKKQLPKVLKANKMSLKKRVRRDWDLYLLLLPGLLWYIIFAYKPMIGLRTAFYDYNIFKGFVGSTFVGFDNFIYFLKGPDFIRTVTNTLMIAFWQMVIVFPIPIALAIMITEMRNKFVSKLTQTATFLPYFISVVVVCGMVINFTSPSTGVVNLMLQKLGFDSVYFMVKPEFFRGIYTGMTLWQTAGFNSIVYIAAIMGIDPQLYEAAKVDGASKAKQVTTITFPSLIPIIVVMFVLNVGKMVKVGFEAILLLYKPTTYATGDVIATYVYRTGIGSGNYGLATAAGLFEAFVALVLVVLANRVSKHLSETSLW